MPFTEERLQFGLCLGTFQFLSSGGRSCDLMSFTVMHFQLWDFMYGEEQVFFSVILTFFCSNLLKMLHFSFHILNLSYW